MVSPQASRNTTSRSRRESIAASWGAAVSFPVSGSISLCRICLIIIPFWASISYPHFEDTAFGGLCLAVQAL